MQRHISIFNLMIQIIIVPGKNPAKSENESLQGNTKECAFEALNMPFTYHYLQMARGISPLQPEHWRYLLQFLALHRCSFQSRTSFTQHIYTRVDVVHVPQFPEHVKEKRIACVCVCVCVCMRMCACVCVCMCVRV